MGYNYTLTRIWGIPIRINVSLIVFLPILAWLIGSGEQIAVYAGLIESLSGVPLDVSVLRAGTTPWLIGALAAVLLFVSVTLHELGHSWVALRYGIEIESITLWILGGLAALKTLPRESNREFWIAIAGPLVSLALGVIGVLGLGFLPESSNVIRFLVGWIAVTNVTLAVFNLLPAFPMDGGRILRAFLARNRSYPSATRLAARVGVAFAIGFVVLGILNGQLMLVLLAVFIYTAATSESRSVMLGDLLSDISVGDIATRDPTTVAADTTVADFTNQILRDRRTAYPVVDDGDVIGVASLNRLKQLSVAERETTTVGEITQSVSFVGANDDAFEAFVEIGSSGVDHALVLDGGELVGVLSQEDFARALTLRREIGTTPRVPQ
jgi:Zn-dependent protease